MIGIIKKQEKIFGNLEAAPAEPVGEAVRPLDADGQVGRLRLPGF